MARPWVADPQGNSAINRQPCDDFRNGLSGGPVLLLFFRAHGRFPRVPEEIDADTIAIVSRQVGDGTASASTAGVSGRTGERHRAEIRALLGFREATVADGETLTQSRASCSACTLAAQP
jgi:Domain of unknown function (DUF4158)